MSADPVYTPTVEQLTACPACGSSNIMNFPAMSIKDETADPCGGCMDCMKAWPMIPAGEDYKRDGEMLAFKEPCDDCAFRAGSPESRDKKAWRSLLSQLKAGGQFYCHKGVPFDLKDSARTGAQVYEFPKRPDGQHDQANMRLCRGFLNAWSRWMDADMRQRGIKA